MKRLFDFSFVDKDGCQNKGSIEVNYEKKKGGQKTFTVSGTFKEQLKNGRWVYSHSGQCLDTVKPYLQDNELFQKIFYLWENYHLNDMHPECIHQRNLGWLDIAKRPIKFYKYYLNIETIKARNILNEKIKNLISNTGEVKITDEEKELYNLPYSVKTYKEIKDSRYNLCDKETEEKILGWICPNEHPNGILTRTCPICGYKYGSAWLYFPIPEEDEKIIFELLGGEI